MSGSKRLRSVRVLVLAVVVLGTVTSCAFPTSASLGTTALTERVSNVRDSLASLVGTSTQSDFSKRIATEFAQDLTSLTQQQKDAVARPLTGYYALETEDRHISTEFVIATSTNSGGFTNQTLSWYSCAHFEGEIGFESLTTSAVDCPDWLLEDFYLRGDETLSIDDLGL